jgi:hypothetical protein
MGGVTVQVNSSFELRYWALNASALALEWIPKISRKLFNEEKPIINFLEIFINEKATVKAIANPGSIEVSPIYVR